jgi:hypothetical protein
MVNNLVGQLDTDTAVSLSGILDEYDAPSTSAPKGTPHEGQAFSVHVDTIASNGRGTMTPNGPQGFPDDLLAFYVVSPGSVRLVSLDTADKHPQVILFDH